MKDFKEFVDKTFKEFVAPYRNYNISVEQMMYINEGIEELKPETFVEIGTCTGTSTGYIANMLHLNNGKELVTLDLLKEWQYEEVHDGVQKPMQSKVIGHMIPILYDKQDVKVTPYTEVNSTHLSKICSDKKFDMGFIDASHVHPWPTLDAIATFPFIKTGARVYFHDVNLHKFFINAYSQYAIGVKFLFDQVPCEYKEVATKDKNIGYIIIPEAGYKQYLEAMIDSLHIPWTTKCRIGHSVIKAYAKLAKEHWGEDLAQVILELSNRYNPEQTYQFSLRDIE